MNETTNDLSENEIQTLIGMIELAEPVSTENNNGYIFFPANENEAKKYFRKYALPWESAYASLIIKGMLEKSKGCHVLTEEGKHAARKIRIERPPIWYWYKEYYRAVSESKAHSIHCKKLYGKDLSQDGFCDMYQLNRMIEMLDIKKGGVILDLGCGNGKIADYISDKTRSIVIGVDYIPEAIEQSNKLASIKMKNLKFILGDINNLTYEAKSFDYIISIDSLYMVHDLNSFVRNMNEFLKDGGKFAAFYSYEVSSHDKSNPSESLDPMGLPPGKTFHRNKISFEFVDFSKENHIHLQKKNRIIRRMKKQYEKEGNDFLYDSILSQSVEGDNPYDERTCNTRRYLYIAKRGDTF